MATDLKHPRDWPYLIVRKSGATLRGTNGLRLPPYVGPFESVEGAQAWGDAEIGSGDWEITDLAMPMGEDG